jgi:hypothetical protein
VKTLGLLALVGVILIFPVTAGSLPPYQDISVIRCLSDKTCVQLAIEYLNEAAPQTLTSHIDLIWKKAILQQNEEIIRQNNKIIELLEKKK